jgi:hypothetical protein
MNDYPLIPPWRSPLSPLGASVLGAWSGYSDAGITLKCQGKLPVNALLNGAGATRVNGVYGPCIHLDGSTGYIDASVPTGIGDRKWSPFTGTIVFWFRTTTTPGSNHMWIAGRSTNTSSSDGVFVLMLQSTALVFACFNSVGGTAASIASGTGYNDGLWHMVAAQFSTGNSKPQRLYIDGVLNGTATSDTSNWAVTQSEPIRWGKGRDAFWGMFNGDIDPGAWFDRWLTAGEIANLYRTGPAGFYRGSTSVALLNVASPALTSNAAALLCAM